jgi:hypothetical protein
MLRSQTPYNPERGRASVAAAQAIRPGNGVRRWRRRAPPTRFRDAPAQGGGGVVAFEVGDLAGQAAFEVGDLGVDLGEALLGGSSRVSSVASGIRVCQEPTRSGPKSAWPRKPHTAAVRAGSGR